MGGYMRYLKEKKKNERLFIALYNGDIKGIREAILNGADITVRDINGRNAVEAASECRTLTPELLSVLIELGFDKEYVSGPNMILGLARNNMLTPEFLEILVQEYGVDINVKDNLGQSPLCLSVGRGYFTPELLETYVRVGADINIRDNAGQTPLMKSIIISTVTPWLLDFLVQHGADINGRDDFGWTPLMLSVQMKNLTPELFHAFVACGADIHAVREAWGYTPDTAMSCLVMYHRFETGVESLFPFLSVGLNIKNMYEGWTPENFLEKLKKNAFLKKGHLNAYALLAAVSMYPERCEFIENIISKQRSNALNSLLSAIRESGKPFPLSENLVCFLAETGGGKIALADNNRPLMVSMLLQCLDSAPKTIVGFLKKRIGREFEKWVDDGVEGADIFVSRLVPYLNAERSVDSAPDARTIEFF